MKQLKKINPQGWLVGLVALAMLAVGVYLFKNKQPDNGNAVYLEGSGGAGGGGSGYGGSGGGGAGGGGSGYGGSGGGGGSGIGGGGGSGIEPGVIHSTHDIRPNPLPLPKKGTKPTLPPPTAPMLPGSPGLTQAQFGYARTMAGLRLFGYDDTTGGMKNGR